MVYEPISKENEEKEVDKLSGNNLTDLQNMTTKKEKNLVGQQCEH